MVLLTHVRLYWLGNQLSLAPRLGGLEASALSSQSQRLKWTLGVRRLRFAVLELGDSRGFCTENADPSSATMWVRCAHFSHMSNPKRLHCTRQKKDAMCMKMMCYASWISWWHTSTRQEGHEEKLKQFSELEWKQERLVETRSGQKRLRLVLACRNA